MEHVLDNPVWNALISGNRHLANGNDRVKYFDKEVSPFAGLVINSAENFSCLLELLPHDGSVLFLSLAEMNFPLEWQVLRWIKGLQMIFNLQTTPELVRQPITPLTQDHVPGMLALTSLTDPGPFSRRTIDFGHYHGIFENEKLVAMAGQRLNPFGYAEISAVCTDPGHTGKGYARQLILHQLHRIRSAGQRPFLHVRSDNERAIHVYKDLGFKTRREVFFYVLRRPR